MVSIQERVIRVGKIKSGKGQNLDSKKSKVQIKWSGHVLHLVGENVHIKNQKN